MIAIVEMEKYIEWSVLRGIGKNLNPFPLYAIVRNAPLQTGKVATSDVLIVVGPLSRVRPRNGILALVVVLLLLPLRSEFIGEL